jgi:acetylornithine/succinyldiaminopimelate/putrescine aminotransferase
LLIFDEVITGFRFPKFSVSNYYGITPDLICLGKAMANGMPISVVGGNADVMNCGEYFVSSTFAGETLSLAAALKTMTLLQTKYDLNDLWERGKVFLAQFNALYPEKLWIEGYPTRGAFKGDDLVKALFWQEACRAGVLFGPSWFFNFCHPPVTDLVVSTCRDIVGRIKTGSVRLLGNMPTTPFAQKARQ